MTHLCEVFVLMIQLVFTVVAYTQANEVETYRLKRKSSTSPSTRDRTPETFSNEHFSTITKPSPFLKQDHSFFSNIFNNGVHLDVISIKSEGIFQLASYAVDPVQGEHDHAHDRDGPPTHLMCHCERQYASKEGKDLLLMDQQRNGYASQPDRLHSAECVGNPVELNLQLGGLRPVESPAIKLSLDILLHEESQLQWQAHTSIVEAFQSRR